MLHSHFTKVDTLTSHGIFYDNESIILKFVLSVRNLKKGYVFQAGEKTFFSYGNSYVAQAVAASKLGK